VLVYYTVRFHNGGELVCVESLAIAEVRVFAYAQSRLDIASIAARAAAQISPEEMARQQVRDVRMTQCNACDRRAGPAGCARVHLEDVMR
jgi:hypothetical protein